MLPEISSYKAKSFISERDTSSIAYEVKRTRAVFDESLSIPGTERRGGWRCPPGTRYGGQITDRFGRNCGWGVSRRLANEISDLGERLENVGDRRRGRRAARAERAAERVRRPGLVERAAGNIARALDTTETVEAPKPARTRRGAGKIDRRRSPRLRDSELRRMDREIDQPNAPRTGDAEVQPARRPRPNAAAARRRPATQQIARDKPKPEAVDAPEAPQPAKKAPVKKAVAKKKVVKKKAPAKKVAARRVTTPAAERNSTPSLSANKPAAAEPRVFPASKIFGTNNGEKVRNWDNAARNIDGVYGGDAVNNINADLIDMHLGVVEENKGKVEELLNRLPSNAPDDAIIEHNGEQFPLARLRSDMENARDAWGNALTRLNARKEELDNQQAPEPEVPAVPEPVDGLRAAFNNRDIGYRRNWEVEPSRVRAMAAGIDNGGERQLQNAVREYEQNIAYMDEYLGAIGNLQSNQVIKLPQDKEITAAELKAQVQAVRNEWEALRTAANTRLNRLNEGRIPGLNGYPMRRAGNVDGHATLSAAEQEFDRVRSMRADERIYLVQHEQKYFVLNQDEFNYAVRNNALSDTNVRKSGGGLPLAAELPEVDRDIAEEAKKRVFEAAKKRQDLLAGYLDKRYGRGNAPWKDMTRERMENLMRDAANGDAAAKRALTNHFKAMYSHAEIDGLNGKTYRAVASVSNADYRGGTFSVSVIFERKNADGSWTRVGSSSRGIMAKSTPPHIYNSTMFIDNAADKNSGIQTIYNQHAFMYAKAAGFKYVNVSAVQDGQYVWGRVGFRQEIPRYSISRVYDEVARFKEGRASIIKSQEDAKIFEHLANSWVRDNNSVRHIDFMMALSNTETSASAKKTRDADIKSWFHNNMAFSGGKFDLDENFIKPDPRDN